MDNNDVLHTIEPGEYLPKKSNCTIVGNYPA